MVRSTIRLQNESYKIFQEQIFGGAPHLTKYLETKIFTAEITAHLKLGAQHLT